MSRTKPKRARQVDRNQSPKPSEDVEKLRDRVVPEAAPIRAACSKGTIRRLAEAGLILQTRGGDDDRIEA